MIIVDHDTGDEDACVHVIRRIEDDPIAALCEMVRDAGLTMTLYGVPVTESELRAGAEDSAHERVATLTSDQVADALFKGATERKKAERTIKRSPRR